MAKQNELNWTNTKTQRPHFLSNQFFFLFNINKKNRTHGINRIFVPHIFCTIQYINWYRRKQSLQWKINCNRARNVRYSVYDNYEFTWNARRRSIFLQPFRTTHKNKLLRSVYISQLNKWHKTRTPISPKSNKNFDLMVCADGTDCVFSMHVFSFLW